MIAICISAYIMIGVIGYIYWGDSAKMITTLYWMALWPYMALWTILANKEDLGYWIRSKRIKDEWKKIKDYFKIDIKGERKDK